MADVLVTELALMTPADERFAATTTVLIESVSQHLDEEQDWFRKVRAARLSRAPLGRRSTPCSRSGSSITQGQARQLAPSGPIGVQDASVASSAVVPTHIRLPGQPPSVGRARRFVRDCLVGAGLGDELVDNAVLLTSEVVTNAVVHVGGDMVLDLAWGHHGALVQLLDVGPSHPIARVADRHAVTGRGVAMIEMLAHRWGSTAVDRGKVVWFSVGETGAMSLPGSVGWTVPGTDSSARHAVLLRELPGGLWSVTRQHDDSLLREYQLLLLSHETGRGDHGDRALVAAVARARAAVAAQIAGAWAVSADPASPVSRIDVVLSVTVDDVAALAAGSAVLDRAEVLAAKGAFLVRPGLPEMRSLREWLVAEIVAQAGGAEPTVWDAGATLVQAPSWAPPDLDLAWVSHLRRALVVADDSNRVIAISPAVSDLLGWTSADIVGQRITVLVPEALREAHVSAFAEHVQTGVSHVMGVPLHLPGRHSQGHDVAVTLHLEQRWQDQHLMYLGWFDARQGSA